MEYIVIAYKYRRFKNLFTGKPYIKRTVFTGMKDPVLQAHLDSAKRRLKELEDQKEAIDFTSKILKSFLNDIRAVLMPNELAGIFRNHTDGMVREFAAFAAKNKEQIAHVQSAIEQIQSEMRSQ